MALTLCSLFVPMAHKGSPDVNASARSQKSEAERAALLEAEIDEAIAGCGGDVRAALRATLIAKRVPGGRNRTIDRSNLNGLRAGADAQGTSAGEEDLEYQRSWQEL